MPRGRSSIATLRAETCARVSLILLELDQVAPISLQIV
jgi:hypothetical protein